MTDFCCIYFVFFDNKAHMWCTSSFEYTTPAVLKALETDHYNALFFFNLTFYIGFSFQIYNVTLKASFHM